METPNILANRYASQKIKNIWSPENKIVLERKFWISVLENQKKLGVKISENAIEAYKKNINNVNLSSIEQREKITKHDVKARIEEFNALAGFEEIHKGMTSRDLTENIEQLQIISSSKFLLNRGVELLIKLMDLANQYSTMELVGRSHNVPAQLTTLGKRFATTAEELLEALKNLDYKINSYKARGIKGPMGTSQDMLDLFSGENEKLLNFEKQVLHEIDFERFFNSVGQIYPRSLDYRIASSILELATGPTNLTTTIRLMAGAELATEGFKKGQVGSSAMPHKMNARSSERVNGMMVLIRGYVNIIAEISGNQWNEGDVSDSVVRRVILPDLFYTIDGLFNTFQTILNGFGAFPVIIEKEVENFLPMLTTTKFLMAAVKKGQGREIAHEIIKKYSIKIVKDFRETGERQSLIEMLAHDKDFPLNENEIKKILQDNNSLIGDSKNQIRNLHEEVEEFVNKFPNLEYFELEEII